jgi:hypothetical protein
VIEYAQVRAREHLRVLSDHKPGKDEQIITILVEVEKGKTVAELCHPFDVSERRTVSLTGRTVACSTPPGGQTSDSQAEQAMFRALLLTK